MGLFYMNQCSAVTHIMSWDSSYLVILVFYHWKDFYGMKPLSQSQLKTRAVKLYGEMTKNHQDWPPNPSDLSPIENILSSVAAAFCANQDRAMNTEGTWAQTLISMEINLCGNTILSVPCLADRIQSVSQSPTIRLNYSLLTLHSHDHDVTFCHSVVTFWAL